MAGPTAFTKEMALRLFDGHRAEENVKHEIARVGRSDIIDAVAWPFASIAREIGLSPTIMGIDLATTRDLTGTAVLMRADEARTGMQRYLNRIHTDILHGLTGKTALLHVRAAVEHWDRRRLKRELRRCRQGKPDRDYHRCPR